MSPCTTEPNNVSLIVGFINPKALVVLGEYTQPEFDRVVVLLLRVT